MIEGTKAKLDTKFHLGAARAMRSWGDPLYKALTICGEELSISFHHKRTVKMTQSWPVGFAILEISKWWMQRLWYDTIRPRFDNRITCLASDTDSVMILAPGRSVDDVVTKLSDIMDFSNYKQDNPLFDSSSKNSLGKIKNELPHSDITEFVGLRAKCYALKTADEKVESRAKGVKRYVKKKIAFETFKKCVSDVHEEVLPQRSIVSKNHQNMVQEQNKVSMSSFYAKRFLLCSCHSTPYGSVMVDYYYNNGGDCYFCSHPDVMP